MKEKTREPKPVASLEWDGEVHTWYYMLDEGDSMAWNTSTNYDHHMSGPSLVRAKAIGVDLHEMYVNDPDAWLHLHALIRWGCKYMQEHNLNWKDIDKFKEQLQKEIDERGPWVSMHKNNPDI